MDRISSSIGQLLEQEYVKTTYDDIADEFSSTRYKKWPKVDAFLKSLPANSLVLDIGCGNGKYLDNSNTFNIGCDLSRRLLSICRSRGFEVTNCDMTLLPFRESTFDAIICIAALHHLASEERRRHCLKQMLDLLDSHKTSSLFVQVWSYEQHLDPDNPYLKQTQRQAPSVAREVSLLDGSKIAVHKNRTPFASQDLLVPFNTVKTQKDDFPTTSSMVINKDETKEHLRYYHVFKQNELETLVSTIPGAVIKDSFYDRGNWCCVVGKC